MCVCVCVFLVICHTFKATGVLIAAQIGLWEGRVGSGEPGCRVLTASGPPRGSRPVLSFPVTLPHFFQLCLWGEKFCGLVELCRISL